MQSQINLDTIKVYLLSLGGRTKIDGLAIGEEVEGIEERESFAAWLMDRHDDCPSSLR